MADPNPPATSLYELRDRIAWRIAMASGSRAERLANWAQMPTKEREIHRAAARAVLREVERFYRIDRVRNIHRRSGVKRKDPTDARS